MLCVNKQLSTIKMRHKPPCCFVRCALAAHAALVTRSYHCRYALLHSSRLAQYTMVLPPEGSRVNLAQRALTSFTDPCKSLGLDPITSE